MMKIYFHKIEVVATDFSFGKIESIYMTEIAFIWFQLSKCVTIGGKYFNSYFINLFILLKNLMKSFGKGLIKIILFTQTSFKQLFFIIILIITLCFLNLRFEKY